MGKADGQETAGRQSEDETVLLVCEDCTQGYVAALPGKQKVQGCYE